MELDKFNAFLATAVGALIFKWLATAVTALVSRLNKSYPSEDFLISQIGIPAYIIRMSYSRYKLNTRPHIKLEKAFLSIFGVLIISVSIFGFIHFTKLFNETPINWIETTYKETKDSFWINSSEAISRPNAEKWKITVDTCLAKNELEKITAIKTETKKYICSYMTEKDKADELSKDLTKYSTSIIIGVTIAYLTLLVFLSWGIGMFIELYINKQIRKFNEAENIRSYEYLT